MVVYYTQGMAYGSVLYTVHDHMMAQKVLLLMGKS